MRWLSSTETPPISSPELGIYERFSTERYPWLSWVFDHLDLPPKGRVLKLGCGTGALWLENIHRIPAGWDITLSDMSPGMLKDARTNLTGSPRAFRFELIDAQSIPHDDEAFDAVVANHMPYHMRDLDQTLAEVRRVLRPGGRLYATTHSHHHMREMVGLVRDVVPEYSVFQGTDVFGLETGMDKLSRWFPEVEMSRRDGHLAVTEAQPLIDYVLSTRRSDLVNAKLDEFTRRVERQILSEGAIHITIAPGIFKAHKAIPRHGPC